MSGEPKSQNSILLIEDNPSDTLLFKSRVSSDESAGFQVQNVPTLQAAEEAIRRETFDIIVLDLALPDSEGLDSFLKIKSLAGATPVVILSGQDDEALALNCVRQGAQEYLLKGSIEGRVFPRLLRHALERHRMTSELDSIADELREANTRLKVMTHLDPLTELFNRRGLHEILSREISWGRREGAPLIAVLIDLDNFKQINDRFGYAVGDIVLKEVSRVLKTSLRSTDYLARIGGDEFMALLPHTRPAEAVPVAEKLRANLSRAAVLVSGGQVQITASFGVKEVQDDIATLDDLLASAHLVLYKSKRYGKNRVSTEKPDALDDGLTDALKEILEAIRSGEAVYSVKQPILELYGEKAVGYEFLSRVNIPAFQMPDEFFRICLEANILTAVDHQCLKACRAGIRKIPKGMICHLNIFPSTLIDTPIGQLAELLPNDRPPEEICLEISEQQIIGDPSYLLASVNALRSEGFQIALDDIGFGRSCLESLTLLNPEVIKIDRKCIHGASQDLWRKRCLERTLRVVRTFDARIVAEGIETRGDLECLKELGVQFGQGYLWGKPC